MSSCAGVGRLTSATEEMDHPRHCQVDLWPRLPFVVHSSLMYTLYKTIVISLSNLASYRAHSLTCALRCIMHCHFEIFDVRFVYLSCKALVSIIRFSNINYICELFIAALTLCKYLKELVQNSSNWLYTSSYL